MGEPKGTVHPRQEGYKTSPTSYGTYPSNMACVCGPWTCSYVIPASAQPLPLPLFGHPSSDLPSTLTVETPSTLGLKAPTVIDTWHDPGLPTVICRLTAYGPIDPDKMWQLHNRGCVRRSPFTKVAKNLYAHPLHIQPKPLEWVSISYKALALKGSDIFFPRRFPYAFLKKNNNPQKNTKPQAFKASCSKAPQNH